MTGTLDRVMPIRSNDTSRTEIDMTVEDLGGGPFTDLPDTVTQVIEFTIDINS